MDDLDLRCGAGGERRDHLGAGPRAARPQSSQLLLEGRPHDLRVEEVARAILTVEGVQEVHDVHLWSLGGGHNALSLHARIPDMHLDECERLLDAIRQVAAKQFGIGHTTVQLERAGLPAKSGYVMPEPAKK